MPFVSVIVPIYNVERYVGECVSSLRAQTFSDFEVVCVDDGSTDSSARVARTAAAGDGRFLFVERENGGLSAARNTGLDHATGEYACFLDSDDAYAPDALARLASTASALDVDVLDFTAHTFYETRRARRLREENFEDRADIEGVFTGRELFCRYWDVNEYKCSACFHLIRRSLLLNAGLRFGEGLLHEDELFSPMLYAHAGSAAFLNEPLYIRRMREGSIVTRRPTAANVRSYFRISQLLHAWLVDNAHDCGADFIDAFARNICSIRDTAFVYLQELDEADRELFVESLGVQDRIDYDLAVRYSGTRAHIRYRELEESWTYRVGNAVVAIPRLLRNGLAWRK